MTRSITRWLSGVKRNDIEASQRFWNEYYAHLVQVARRRFKEYPRAAYDEEDAATSALASFLNRAANGLFDGLENRESIWKLLTTITIRKVNRRLRRRPPGEVVETSEVASERLPPELIVEAQDTVERMFQLLRSDDLRQTALLRLEGYSNQEVAERLSCSVKSIERRIRLVRLTWNREDEKETDREE